QAWGTRRGRPTARRTLCRPRREPRGRLMVSVLLVVPPYQVVYKPAIGVSLLKGALRREGIPCDVSYLNLQFAALAGPALYEALSTESACYAALLGEWLFSGDLFGAAAPDPARYLD